MSAETKEKLEAAIQAHLADEFDGSVMLTGYIMQAGGSTAASEKSPLIYCAMDSQSGVTTMGLLAYANYNAESESFDGLE
jgi:hypothetical protein